MLIKQATTCNTASLFAIPRQWLKQCTALIPGLFFLISPAYPAYGISDVAYPPDTKGLLNISISISSKRLTRNFNPLGATALPSTDHFIFEPLVIYKTRDNGSVVHRLATDFTYSPDYRAITYRLRKGVLWSDGNRFDANDVLFTYHLIRKHPELDKLGLWKNTLHRVQKKDSYTIVFHLNDINTSAEWQLAQQPIVPEHQWKHVKNPSHFRNETPVGTGPFTEIRHFSDFSYEQIKNPHYWETNKPRIEGLRLMAFSDNEAAQKALADGTIDWGGIFIPDIKKNFVDKNPKDHHYWFPPGAMISLYMNATQKPFNDVRFRKALSTAINREIIVESAMYGYALASRYPTGIGELYHSWMTGTKSDSYGKTGSYSPYESVTLLNEAGYRDYDGDGFRENPDRSDLSITISAPKGWTDWETACKITASFFNDIGIKTTTQFYPFPVFNQRLIHSEFMTAMCGGDDGPSPWITYFKLFGKGLRKEYRGGQNWCGYLNKEAELLVNAYVKTDVPAVHKSIIHQLQKIVAETVPIIPLFSSPSWYEYNNSRFKGWASADNPFVMPTFFPENPERLLHVLALSPVTER